VEQTVWLVENGELRRSVIIDEVGVSDRTWVEVRGGALEELSEGMELAVAFTKESEGSASAGPR